MNHVVKADESLILGYNPITDTLFFISNLEEAWTAHLIQETGTESPHTIYFFANLSQDV